MSDGEMITVAVATAGLIVAMVAAWLSWFSVAMLRRQITADLLLRFHERLDDFHDVQVRLRPGGK